MKPRNLIDIKYNGSSFGEIPSRINLNKKRAFNWLAKLNSTSVKFAMRILFVLLIISFFVFSSALAPTNGGVRAAQNDEERKALESQLADLENQISKYETILAQYKQQGKTLKSEINRLNAQISKLNLQIKVININLAKIDKEIIATQSQINNIENKIDVQKHSLSVILQNVYESDGKDLMMMLLENPKLSDFFGDLNGLLAIQENLRITLEKVVALREELIDQKETLGLERMDTAALKAYRDNQKANLQKMQRKKSDLLKATKGKESEYQKILTKTKKTAAQIRSRIFEMLGGGELNFENAYKLAKFAEGATGVRAALILAVLDRESALGKNVGRCNYKTAMHPTRDIPIFLEIVKKLNLNPDTITVSCPNADGAFGGAMGPAQFIPSTWDIYDERITEITGSNPASPWRNVDAFVATALYLKDAGAAGGSVAAERKAAAKYYAGSRWSRYLWTYGERVITRARQFQEDIDVLNA